MKVLSLFDGISCARVALDRLGAKDVTYFSSEVDKYAMQIAQKNFPDTIQLGDIRGLSMWDGLLISRVVEASKLGVKCVKTQSFNVGGIDLMIGGSPCQDLSIAKRNREGLRGGAFWAILGVCETTQRDKTQVFYLGEC